MKHHAASSIALVDMSVLKCHEASIITLVEISVDEMS
jgi:hypothetical protein